MGLSALGSVGAVVDRSQPPYCRSWPKNPTPEQKEQLRRWAETHYEPGRDTIRWSKWHIWTCWECIKLLVVHLGDPLPDRDPRF